jgi:hypothetical protein
LLRIITETFPAVTAAQPRAAVCCDAEKPALYQGMTSLSADKCISGSKKRQGMTFSRAGRVPKEMRALAPEGFFF